MFNSYFVKRSVAGAFLAGLALCLLCLLIPSIKYSRFMLTLFPPKDLYVPIIYREVSLDESNSKYDFLFKQKYAGTYMFGLRVDHPPDYRVGFKTSAEIRIYIKKGDSTIFRLTKVPWSERFGDNDINSGVIFGYYKAPESIPLGIDVDFQLIIENPDSSFCKRYGKSYFFIRRASDV